MAQGRFPILTAPGGSEIIPVANATLYTADMSAATGNNTQVYAEFFSDAAGLVPVTPTAGTVTISASPLGNNYLAAPNAASISATACATPFGTYTPPLFQGRVANGRAILAGITGAAYARIWFWNY
jgi:hypothetical protein